MASNGGWRLRFGWFCWGGALGATVALCLKNLAAIELEAEQESLVLV